MKNLDISVLEAARIRFKYIFEHFDNVYVSFSGGKDSGVLLNLALTFAKEFGFSGKIGVFHLDYEAQYSMTTEYVDRVYGNLGDSIVNLRCCVPVKCPTSTSMFESYWRPWEESKSDIWVRDLPSSYLQKKDFDFFNENLSDYDFQERFSLWYHNKKQAKKTCVLVGIRAQESLDRWRTIVSDRNINKYNGICWTTILFDNVVNAYPIYDWSTEDVWIANGKFEWDYNKLYDLMYLAGVPIHAQRVASPFNNYAKASLSLYRVIDSNTWGKMVSRVNGVNFTALYGNTTMMGWRNVTKPDGFTWEQYAFYLLDSLPDDIANNYKQKLETSIKFWRNKGGCLSDDTIKDLRSIGVPITIGGKTNYKTDKKPVAMEYIDDYEGREFQLVPSWKRLCVCILKNDHVGKYMGFAMNKHESQKRKDAIEKYENIL